ncbi:MAG: hypothetical protein M3M97_06725 [Actinomycetota bacterium]|nr:hypothetical protein [Actinomycetota bacterium]
MINGRDQVADMRVPENETNRAKRTAERASDRSPGSTYWLIAKDGNGPMEVLTMGLDGGDEVLPVFSFKEEAEMFLRLGGEGDGWRVRESGAGEVVSVLYGPCAGVKEVALDPLPEMVAERKVGLVSLGRKSFAEHLTNGGRPRGFATMATSEASR